MKPTLTFHQIREMFWVSHPQFKRRGRTKQNDYSCAIRCYWCDFVEHLRRDGAITEKQAGNITL